MKNLKLLQDLDTRIVRHRKIKKNLMNYNKKIYKFQNKLFKKNYNMKLKLEIQI